MIDITVVHFIGTDDQDHIAKRRIVGQHPIMPGNRWCGDIGDFARVDLRQILAVAEYRLSLETADDAVRGCWADEVKSQKPDVEYPLYGKDDEAFEGRWLCHLDEGHKVHALILGFLHQDPDPPIVVAHAAQTAQMRHRGADLAGDRRNDFENDGAVTVALGDEGIGNGAQGLGEA